MYKSIWDRPTTEAFSQVRSNTASLFVDAYYASISVIEKIETPEDVVNTFKLADSEKRIPPLSHPVYEKGLDAALIDVRRFSGSQRRTAESNGIKRAHLEREWINGTGNFRWLSTSLSLIYGKWIVSALNKRYSLEATDLVIIEVVLSYLYSLLINEEGYEKSLKDGQMLDDFKAYAMRNMRYKGRFVEQLVEQGNLAFFFDEVFKIYKERGSGSLFHAAYANLHTVLVNNAFDAIDESSIQLLASDKYWFGPNSDAIVLSAMEHPPTLTFIVHEVLTTSSFYRKTKLGTIIDSFGRRNDLKSFLGIYGSL